MKLRPIRTLIAAGVLTVSTALAAAPGPSGEELGRTEVRQVQQALNAAGFRAGRVDGYWGRSTERALRELQRTKGLPATGSLDERTVLALGFPVHEFAGGRYEETPALSDNDVRQVQEALNKAGHPVGPVDGHWGATTTDALRDFQRTKGLDPTGRLDEKTVLALGFSPAEFAAGEFQGR